MFAVDIYYTDHGEVDSFFAFHKNCTSFTISMLEEILIRSIVNLKKSMIGQGRGAELMHDPARLEPENKVTP